MLFPTCRINILLHTLPTSARCRRIQLERVPTLMADEIHILTSPRPCRNANMLVYSSSPSCKSMTTPHVTLHRHANATVQLALTTVALGRAWTSAQLCGEWNWAAHLPSSLLRYHLAPPGQSQDNASPSACLLYLFACLPCCTIDPSPGPPIRPNDPMIPGCS
jgi:hypothetical protein